MVINYFGEGCFRLQSGDFSILVDPNSNRLKGDVTLRTVTETGSYLAEANEIAFPGEYEVRGVEISGWPVPEESNGKQVKGVYLIKWEDITFGILGQVSENLNTDLLEKLDAPDVLIVPIGEGKFLSPKDAAKIAKQLEPAVVIPSFCKDAKDFLKEMGQQTTIKEKLVFKKKELDPSKIQVEVLGVS